MGITITNSGQGSVVRFRNLGRGGVMTSTTIQKLLLNFYPGAAAAYSLRLLNNTYTGAAIRVRRSSDSTETNIGFVNGQLDTASLLTFCGVGSGFVTTWFDQSGNANNAVQSTTTSQPTIVLSGVIYLQNTKPTMFFNGIGVSNDLPFTGIVADTNTSTYLVGKAVENNRAGGPMFGHTEFVPGILIGHFNNGVFYVVSKLNGTMTVAETSTNSFDSNFLIQNAYITTDIKIYKNNTLIPISSQSSFGGTQLTINTIGKYGNIGVTNGYISEAIIYKTDQSSNRTGINANINSYYSIF